MHSSTINHQLACMPPQVTKAHAEKHDELMISSATAALNLDTPISLSTKVQLMLPLSKGGFGLLSAAHTAAPAYISAVFTTLTHAPPFLNVPPGSNTVPAGSALEESINFAISEARTIHQHIANTMSPTPAQPVKENLDTDILPSSASTLVRFYHNKQLPSIQSALSSRISNHLYSALVKGASDFGNRFKRDSSRSHTICRC